MRPGHIALIVHDTAVIKGFSVFVQITKHRKLNKFGNLADCNAVSKGCDFVSLKPRKGHPGHWQADHVNCSVTGADRCHVTSKIGSFHVG